MFEAVADAGAASRLFDLSEYQVVDVTRGERRHRTLVVRRERFGEAACPSCAVATSRVHRRTAQHLRGGQLDVRVGVVWVKRRWWCAEVACGRATFTGHTDHVPAWARLAAGWAARPSC